MDTNYSPGAALLIQKVEEASQPISENEFLKRQHAIHITNMERIRMLRGLVSASKPILYADLKAEYSSRKEK